MRYKTALKILVLFLLMLPYPHLDAAQANQPQQLVLWDASTGQSQAIADAQEFQWSPDGQSLVVINASGLCVISTSGAVKACKPAPQDKFSSVWIKTARWSPDGRYIAYNILGQMSHNCSSSVEIVTADDLKTVESQIFITGFYWSADSAYLAMVIEGDCGNDNDQQQLMTYSLLTHQTYTIRPIGHYLAVGPGAWSHQGNRLTYVVSDFRIPGAIYINNAQGTDEQRVVSLTAFINDAQWSPDDQQIDYAKNSQVDLNGKNIMIFTGGSLVRWSPTDSNTGLAVITLDNQLPNQAYLFNHKDVDPIVFFQLKANYRTFSWSPDGKQIAFDVLGQSPSLYIMQASDPSLGQSFKAMVDGHDPAWSPDGQTLAYLSGQPQN